MTAEPPTGALEPPPGFALLPSTSPFVSAAGRFFTAETDGCCRIGTWIGSQQADSQRVADPGFLAAFADFALTDVTTGITLRMSMDYLGPRPSVGEWLEAVVKVRAVSPGLVFADTIVVTGAGREVMRVNGMFRPFRRRRETTRQPET